MTQMNHYPSTFDRLRHSKSARAAATLLALALTGCAANSAPSTSQPGNGGKASAVAVGARTPGTAPLPSSPATSPAANSVPLSAMCRVDSPVIDKAFEFGNSVNVEADCIVPSTPETPGMPVLRWTIGQFSIVVDKETGLNGRVMKGLEQYKGVQTFTVDGSTGVVEPGLARIDVGLPDGTVAQMEAQGPFVTPARTDPALVAAASILMGFNGINPYSTPIAG